MGSKSGGSSTTTVQKADPWGGVQPYLTSYLNNAGQIASQPYQAYQGPRIAGFSPEQQAGMQMTTSRALNGSPVMNAMQGNLQHTLSGGFMNPNSNPWLQQNVQTAMDQAMGNINSQFNKPGAFGGTAHQGVAAKQLGNISAQMYGQNYDNERQRQMQANLFAPQAAQADYLDAQQLMGVGNINREFTQSLMDQDYADWAEAQQYPYMQSDFMRNAVLAGQGAGGTNTSTSKGPSTGSSGLANALGYGAAGYGIANSILGMGGANAAGAALGAMPWAAGAAVLGGLLG